MENIHFLILVLSSNAICLKVASGNLDPKVISTKFTATKTCGLQDQIDNGCVQQRQGVRSLVECLALCRGGCSGVIVGDPGTCYISNQCDIKTSICNVNDTAVRLYEKISTCQNGGLWNSTLNNCKCFDGWVGQSCERLAKTCSELRNYGYPTVYPEGCLWVDLDIDNYPTPMRVKCDVRETYSNTMLAASSGVYSFNRTWSQYLKGFVFDWDNYWLGLDQMKALNDDGLKILVIHAGFVDNNNAFNMFLKYYVDFEMNDSSSGFDFTFSSKQEAEHGPLNETMDFGDCISPIQGGKFSTFDNDNDEDVTANCAAQAGVGWWFKDCDMVCNPLGFNYHTKPGPESKSHLKMDILDYAETDIFKTSDFLMYFQSRK